MKAYFSKRVTFSNHLAPFRIGIRIVAIRHNEMVGYAYVDAHNWIMQVHLSFLSLSLTYNLNICTWSLGSWWPLLFLGNSLLFKIELTPICDCRIYFLRLLHDLFPLICLGAGPSNHLWQYRPNLLQGGSLICLFISLWVHVTLYILVYDHAWGYSMNFCICFINLLPKYSCMHDVLKGKKHIV